MEKNIPVGAQPCVRPNTTRFGVLNLPRKNAEYGRTQGCAPTGKNYQFKN
jgi:hypothetical protein